MKKTVHSLTESQKQDLTNEIKSFLDWLPKKSHTNGFDKRKVIFPTPTSKDWTMQVKNDREVRFNTYLISECSYEYYKTIVLHEAFHLIVQNIPNKEDAQNIKDNFGDVWMKLFDIEADYFTARYFKEKLNYNFIEWLTLLYEGSSVFGDPRIRITKLERFIGSILSIGDLYFQKQKNGVPIDRNLYLPSINNIPTDDSIYVLVASNDNFVLKEIKAGYQDFYELKQCYTNASGYNLRGYVERLIKFTAKALGYDGVPDELQKKLNKL